MNFKYTLTPIRRKRWGTYRHISFASTIAAHAFSHTYTHRHTQRDHRAFDEPNNGASSVVFRDRANGVLFTTSFQLSILIRRVLQRQFTDLMRRTHSHARTHIRPRPYFAREEHLKYLLHRYHTHRLCTHVASFIPRLARFLFVHTNPPFIYILRTKSYCTKYLECAASRALSAQTTST